MNNTPQSMVDLSNKATNNNWDEVKMIAHKMKSSFNTIGAKDIGGLLARVELEAADDNKTNLCLLINQAKGLGSQAFDEIKEELNK